MKTLNLQNLSDKEHIYSGVYLITFPNNKKYVGISNNVRRRMVEHNQDFRNNLPIEHAIQKYGKIADFILLEEIAPENRSQMREREKYWIAKYHSNNKNFGYNVSEGGDGADIGSNNSQARFTEEQILQIYEELRKTKKTMTEIAKEYDVDLHILSYINNGKTYFHSNVIYPIRNGNQKILKGTESCNSKFSEEDLENIIFLLKENKLSMKEIALKYGVVDSTIHGINNGKTYFRENETYPLRVSKSGSRKLTNQQVVEIIALIKSNPKMSFKKIGELYGVSSKCISSINCGTTYKQNQENYPIRKK